MMTLIRAECCSLLLTSACMAQNSSLSPEIQVLDHLAGDWTLRGSIAGKQTTHDVHAEWVLNHEYLHLHEVSRDKDSGGHSLYEAIVYISWEPKLKEYTCLWLDSTAGGGLSAQGFGHAKSAANSIPFIFTTSATDSIHTTFSYDRRTDTWTWLIDNEAEGKADRFAEVKLSRTP